MNRDTISLDFNLGVGFFRSAPFSMDCRGLTGNNARVPGRYRPSGYEPSKYAKPPLSVVLCAVTVLIYYVLRKIVARKTSGQYAMHSKTS